MAVSKTYKRNDTGPPITITCLDGEFPKDLTEAASAKFLMGTVDNTGVSTVKAQGAMTFSEDRTLGQVTYEWAEDDLDTVGTYKVEVEITWTGGEVQTFPDDSYLQVIVVADVG